MVSPNEGGRFTDDAPAAASRTKSTEGDRGGGERKSAGEKQWQGQWSNALGFMAGKVGALRFILNLS